jgi:hypothetical protein
MAKLRKSMAYPAQGAQAPEDIARRLLLLSWDEIVPGSLSILSIWNGLTPHARNVIGTREDFKRLYKWVML